MFRPSDNASRSRAMDQRLRRGAALQEQPQQSLKQPSMPTEISSPKMQTDLEGLALINAFQTHVDDMRNLIMCKICIRPLYEPFSLGCGHTYCYSCLSEWFGSRSNRRKRNNCPDCRAEVKAQPAPNYLFRELVHMFVSRLELLDRDETLQEHHEAMLAEARQVEKDKNDRSDHGGLFRGVFKTFGMTVGWGRGLIRDYEDGVDRCPRCTWELEEGVCNQCGYDAAGSPFSDDDDERSYSTDYDGNDFGDSELDGDIELEDEDAFGYDFDLHRHARLPIHHGGHRHRISGATANRAISVPSDSETDRTAIIQQRILDRLHGRYSDNTSGDDETGSEMQSFIDDDEFEEENSDDSTIRTRSPHSPISVSSNHAEDHEVDYDFSITNSFNSEREDSEEDAEEDSEEEEEDVIQPTRKPPGRILRRNRVVMDSSEDEESEASESERRTSDGDVSESHASEDPTFMSPPPPRSAADRRARREAQRARRHR